MFKKFLLKMNDLKQLDPKNLSKVSLENKYDVLKEAIAGNQ